MAQVIQAIRGMNDILPVESSLWQYAESIIRRVFHSHGYQEIRTPILEKTELFKRSIGEVTDIVEKEMYTFLDRNEDSLTMRPEGTASCVRAGLEHGLFHNQVPRLWYGGPCFRYERPQKGRYRQFHQYSAEVFGLTGPDIDAEIIAMSAAVIERLGLREYVTLHINSLGTLAARQKYRKLLQDYFKKHMHELDEDSQRRLDKNPLRILDSKNPDLAGLISKAPKLTAHLDEESITHFEQLQQYLNHLDIAYEINPCLVRGLDYYSKTVFEWTTTHLGTQGAICGGGRYDTLVEQLGGKPTPALGFSFGMERTLLLMQHAKINKEKRNDPHAYIISDSDAAFQAGLKIANYLRAKVRNLRIVLHCGGGSMKSQFKKADKSGAKYAIIIGEHEMKTHSVALKSLREDIPQQSLFQDELAEYFNLQLSKR